MHNSLFSSLSGGIILGYGGEPNWKTELVAMLKDDRVGVIDDGRFVAFPQLISLCAVESFLSNMC